MFIPLRVDVIMKRAPFANWALIAVIILVFWLEKFMGPTLLTWLILQGSNPISWVTHIFIHANFMHLAGNMMFLWIFGNAVCSKMGNVWYIPFFLGAGILSGLTHVLFSKAPVVGASGAINGVVGMYLIFFGLNYVTMFVFLLFTARNVRVPGLYVILFWFLGDVWGTFSGAGGVAYLAHVGGFLAGVGTAVGLIKQRLIGFERYEEPLIYR